MSVGFFLLSNSVPTNFLDFFFWREHKYLIIFSRPEIIVAHSTETHLLCPLAPKTANCHKQRMQQYSNHLYWAKASRKQKIRHRFINFLRSLLSIGTADKLSRWIVRPHDTLDYLVGRLFACVWIGAAIVYRRRQKPRRIVIIVYLVSLLLISREKEQCSWFVHRQHRRNYGLIIGISRSSSKHRK